MDDRQLIGDMRQAVPMDEGREEVEQGIKVWGHWKFLLTSLEISLSIFVVSTAVTTK